jgi:hypothetical protein
LVIALDGEDDERGNRLDGENGDASEEGADHNVGHDCAPAAPDEVYALCKGHREKDKERRLHEKDGDVQWSDRGDERVVFAIYHCRLFVRMTNRQSRTGESTTILKESRGVRRACIFSGENTAKLKRCFLEYERCACWPMPWYLEKQVAKLCGSHHRPVGRIRRNNTHDAVPPHNTQKAANHISPAAAREERVRLCMSETKTLSR